MKVKASIEEPKTFIVCFGKVKKKLRPTPEISIPG